MQFIRTTLRLKEDLKKRAEKKAFDENISLQAIFNRALELYLDQNAKRQAKEIIFKTHDLGIALDNLRRKDFYKIP